MVVDIVTLVLLGADGLAALSIINRNLNCTANST